MARHAVPKILNDLKGDPGKRRRYQSEPEAEKGAPVCPKYLDDVAKKEWKSVCKQLDSMGLLTKVDRMVIELYCEAYSRYRIAQEQVREHGAVLLSKNRFEMKSPWASEMDTQFATLKGLLIQFGMTPCARANMRVDVKNKEGKKGIGKFINAA